MIVEELKDKKDKFNIERYADFVKKYSKTKYIYINEDI